MIYVELLTPALAEITVVPRWWRRWFRREREQTRFVVLGACSHWHYDDTGRLVIDEFIVAALDTAIAVHRALRPVQAALVARRSSAPPN